MFPPEFRQTREESLLCEDWLAERWGFEPPRPFKFVERRFGPSLAGYSAPKKASVLERNCSPGIRLFKRLDALWRYDQYIANAEGTPSEQDMWRDLKRQEIDNVKCMKQIIIEQVRQNCS